MPSDADNGSKRTTFFNALTTRSTLQACCKYLVTAQRLRCNEPNGALLCEMYTTAQHKQALTCRQLQEVTACVQERSIACELLQQRGARAMQRVLQDIHAARALQCTAGPQHAHTVLTYCLHHQYQCSFYLLDHIQAAQSIA